MTKVFLIPSALILACLLSPGIAAEKETFHQDWLDRDLELIHQTKLALGPSSAQGVDIDNFLKILHPSSVRADRDLGCGIRQVRLALYGGYSTIWMNLAVVEKKVVALNCMQSGSPDSWSRIAPTLEKAWGNSPYKQEEHSLKLASYIDHKIIDDLTARAFGSVQIALPQGGLEEPFALLMSPLEESDVGNGCYVGGDKPEGRIAMEKLTEAGRYDLLRAILRGPSPEGRAYAALALNKDKKASADDIAVQDKLRNLKVPIHVCHGCMVSTETFDEVMAEKRYGL